MSFEQKFIDWIEGNLAERPPANVKGFVFNLYEYEPTDGVRFGIDLVGTGAFDVEDSDWACDEIWEPEERVLLIPEAFSGEDWEECQSRIRGLLSQVLGSDSLGSSNLKRAKGIGLGFAEGDLDVVWNA